MTELPSTEVLPSRFTIHFRARISDDQTANRPPLQGMEFRVLTYQEASEEISDERIYSLPRDPSQKRYVLNRVFSNNEGYITWQETYNYLTPGDNRWVYFERVITSASEKWTSCGSLYCESLA